MSNLITTTLKEIYEIDEYLWLSETIKILRKSRLEDLNLKNLIGELENLGKRDLNKVRSLLRQIIIHLLFLEY